ncbi:MAG: tetratricopeptide repeat protein [Bdellovibrionales bacterium]
MFLTGCNLASNWISRFRIQTAVKRGDSQTAVRLLQRAIEEDPDGPSALDYARTGARLAHVDARNYLAATEFYRMIVLRSESESERLSAQKNIATLALENLQDFNQAVIELERLLRLDMTEEDRFRFRLNLAKAHFQLNNLEQATHELDDILTKPMDPDWKFDAMILKANVLVSGKKLADAAKIWEEVLKEFPERSKREKTGLDLVVCYEELKNFDKAIEVLEHMKADYPNPDFLEIRIQRLQDRRSNMPGAQGWKR